MMTYEQWLNTRCKMPVKAEGVLRQCTRRKGHEPNGDYCTVHSKVILREMIKNGTLKT